MPKAVFLAEPVGFLKKKSGVYTAMSTPNNQSLKVLSSLVKQGRLVKEASSKRSVVLLNGEKYSFSCSNDDYKLQCRQVYEDCVGFISMAANGSFWKYKSHNLKNGVSPNRISPSGKKAYSITRYTDECERVYI